jgi:TRAP-type C4-dicarboxylate transport system permease small subunit
VTLLASGLPGRIRGSLERAGEAMANVAGLAYLVCAGLIGFDVVSRRLFGFSSQGTVELSGYILAIGFGLGASNALARKAHVRVDVLVPKMPRRVQVILHLFALASLIAFVALLTWRVWDVALTSWRQDIHEASALFFPVAWPQIPWVIGITFMLVYACIVFIEMLTLVARGRPDAVIDRLASLSVIEETEEALAAGRLVSESERGL